MGNIHTVVQGEYLSLIARNYGFRDWRPVYGHARNAEFRKKRPDPNVIYPGDQIYIPDKTPQEFTLPTTRTHVFEVITPKRPKLRLILRDQTGRPLAKEPYEVTIGDEKISKTTDGAGTLEHEIPLGIETVGLLLKRQRMRWKLQVGHLDPVGEQGHDPVIEGIQARLNNLGFWCGAVDGILGPKTQRALKLFQAAAMNRRDPDGQPDDETRNRLKQMHRS